MTMRLCKDCEHCPKRVVGSKGECAKEWIEPREGLPTRLGPAKARSYEWACGAEARGFVANVEYVGLDVLAREFGDNDVIEWFKGKADVQWSGAGGDERWNRSFGGGGYSFFFRILAYYRAPLSLANQFRAEMAKKKAQPQPCPLCGANAAGSPSQGYGCGSGCCTFRIDRYPLELWNRIRIAPEGAEK